MQFQSLPRPERRAHAAAGIVAGAAAGSVAGVLDALLGGAGQTPLVVGYVGALGLALGAVLGFLGGVLSGVALRSSPSRATPQALLVSRATRAAGVGVLVSTFAVAAVPLAAVFSTAFRNRELAAVTLAVAAAVLLAAAVFVGGVAAGLVERLLMRLAADRRVRIAQAVPYLSLAFTTAALGSIAFVQRAHLDLGDARLIFLALAWLCATLALRRLLIRRAFRLATLPWAVRRAALVTLVVCGYASFQLASGSAPKAVAQARQAISLAAVVLPVADDAPSAVAGANAAARLAKEDAAAKRAIAEKRADARKIARGLPPFNDLGGSRPPIDAAPKGPAPSLVLVTLSSVRADRLPTYGYARPTMPLLDAFAKRRCSVFERAFASSSAERDALPALLSGRLPSQLRRGSGRWPKVLRQNRLLGEVLSGAGYHATAVVSHDAHGRESGLGEGFASFDTSTARRGEREQLTTATSEGVARKAVAALVAAPKDKPVFLWAHFADPHGRYLVHEVSEPRSRPRTTSDKYDAELSFTDQHLATLLDAAEKHERPTWIVVVADHGESLGELGRVGHGRSLGQAEVHVPLIVCAPGARARRVEVPVSTLDLYPTLLEAAGVPLPKQLPGRSLVAAALRGEKLGKALIAIENTAMPGNLGAAALVDGFHKMVMIGAGNFPRLFDLRGDPGERRSRAPGDKERVRKMQIALQQIRVPPSRAVAKGKKGKGRVIQATDDAAEKEALERAQKRQRALWGSP